MKKLTIYEERSFAWRKCSICGKQFKSHHVYEEAFGLTLADEDCVCLSCQTTNPKGAIFKAVAEENRQREALEFKGFIQDGEDIFGVYK